MDDARNLETLKDTETQEVVIHGFHPLNITWPEGELVGKVRLVLPPIHVQIYDLSMGGIVPGSPHLGSDAPIAGFSVKFEKPADKGDFMKFILKEMMDAIQRALGEKCLTTCTEQRAGFLF